MKIYLKSHFWHENGHHYVMLLNMLTARGLSILIHGVIPLDMISCDIVTFGYLLFDHSIHCIHYCMKLNQRILLHQLTLCMLGNFSCLCCRLLTFQNYFFQKILSGALSECQMVWIQIRTDILSVLIWVQTVCKSYQQTTSHR